MSYEIHKGMAQNRKTTLNSYLYTMNAIVISIHFLIILPAKIHMRLLIGVSSVSSTKLLIRNGSVINGIYFITQTMRLFIRVSPHTNFFTDTNMYCL